ncbi:DUF6417 family protein [Streptomyces sp. NBC_00243]|nr:DUF6417 family protein [Streptomyces sp. NBC_00243]
MGGPPRAVGSPTDPLRPRHPRLRPVPPPARAVARRDGSAPTAGQLTPSQMTALRHFVQLAGELRVPPADGLAEEVRTASWDHGIKRWRLYHCSVGI